jgi:hypothetical protein
MCSMRQCTCLMGRVHSSTHREVDASRLARSSTRQKVCQNLVTIMSETPRGSRFREPTKQGEASGAGAVNGHHLGLRDEPYQNDLAPSGTGWAL